MSRASLLLFALGIVSVVGNPLIGNTHLYMNGGIPSTKGLAKKVKTRPIYADSLKHRPAVATQRPEVVLSPYRLKATRAKAKHMKNVPDLNSKTSVVSHKCNGKNCPRLLATLGGRHYGKSTSWNTISTKGGDVPVTSTDIKRSSSVVVRAPVMKNGIPLMVTVPTTAKRIKTKKSTNTVVTPSSKAVVASKGKGVVDFVAFQPKRKVVTKPTKRNNSAGEKSVSCGKGCVKRLLEAKSSRRVRAGNNGSYSKGSHVGNMRTDVQKPQKWRKARPAVGNEKKMGAGSKTHKGGQSGKYYTSLSKYPLPCNGKQCRV